MKSAWLAGSSRSCKKPCHQPQSGPHSRVATPRNLGTSGTGHPKRKVEIRRAYGILEDNAVVDAGALHCVVSKSRRHIE